MSLGSIFKSIEAGFASFFSKEEPIIQDALSKANSFVNIVKVFGESATGQTIIALLEAFVPAGVVAKVIQVASIAITDLGLATAEAAKPHEQILLDAVSAAASKTGDAKIIAYSNIATLIAKGISDATGGTLSTQQAIVLTPVVHNQSVLNPTPVAVDPAA